MTDKHTPLPWKTYLDDSQIGDAEGGGICVMWRYSVEIPEDNGEAQANAKLIVTAVNSHQLLVDALEFYANEDNWTGWSHPNGDIEEAKTKGDQGNIAEAALKAARGE